MPGFRQLLAGQLRSAVKGAMAYNDQKYGRQLASLLERHALMLRATFGGDPLWRTGSAARTPALHGDAAEIHDYIARHPEDAT
jgi:hypothetical protein